MSPYDMMRAACGRVQSADGHGTAYLVAADRLATCEHVVRSVATGEDVDVYFGETARKATVLEKDATSDSALLDLKEPLTGVAPLPLAGAVTRKAVWDGFGFVGLANNSGAPLTGEVMDPDHYDDLGHPALVLYSPQVAAGMASPLHGFSGSPVLVNGAVVGHIKRILSDPESPGRPALGFVYATPSSAVLTLLGTAPAVAEVQPPPVSISDRIPTIAEGDYHAFVSYRSSDRPFALKLVERLEGTGFRIFLDQRELVPGDALANSLQRALAKSHAGIVLISREWLDSPWCQQEANTFLKRATEDPNYRVVPVRLDDSPLPPFWDGTVYIDFRGQATPQGGTLDRLMWALLGQKPPAPQSAAYRVSKAERESTDKLAQEVAVASKVSGRHVYNLWKRWRSAGVTIDSASLLVAEALLDSGSADHALEVLQQCPEGTRAKQLRALALKRTGRMDEAIEILAKLHHSGELDPETVGMLAGVYKREWVNRGDRAALLAAYDIYRAGFDQSGDSYNGINAAALALWKGAKTESAELAQKVLDLFAGKNEAELNEWDLATKAEAFLLLGDLASARRWYEKAVAVNPRKLNSIAVMRRQARITLNQLGLRRDALDASLPVPGIAVFSGHMTDAPERAEPRFPQGKEGKVRLALREKLRAHNVGIGFSSAARGGDLLFIEEILNRGGDVKVYLPFPRAAFARTSVGPEWVDRFERILAHARVEVKELSAEIPKPVEEPNAYARCNDEIRNEAMILAREVEETPVLLTVWDGKAGSRGGTGDAVASWQSEGIEPENINPLML